MYISKIKALGLIAFVVMISSVVSAQVKKKGGKTPARSNSSASTSAYGKPAPKASGRKSKVPGKKGQVDNGADNQQSAYGTTNPSSSSSPKKADLPITFVKSSGSGLGDSAKVSLRNDNAVQRQLIKDRTPLVYEPIREDDAVYSQRLWLEVDTREKLNLPFGYSADGDNGNERFISILFSGIMNDSITAFSSDDDRFTTPLTKLQVRERIFGGSANDTTEKYDLKGNVIGYEVREKAINPDSIYKYIVKEDVVFDKNTSKLYRRILGIAPIMNRISSTGVNFGSQTLFWVYYPDMRPVFAKRDVYNAKNQGARMTWEDLFEQHMFSYHIIKTTLNNVRNRNFSDYITDPLFVLLEGEKVKETLFNYEQDLWSY